MKQRLQGRDHTDNAARDPGKIHFSVDEHGQPGSSKYGPPCSLHPERLTATQMTPRYPSGVGLRQLEETVCHGKGSKEPRQHLAHVSGLQPVSQSYHLAEETQLGACENRGHTPPCPGTLSKSLEEATRTGPEETTGGAWRSLPTAGPSACLEQTELGTAKETSAKRAGLKRRR